MIRPEEIKRIKKIEISAKKLSGETFAGEYKSAFKGRGIYFDEIREYQSGDDVRLIDWQATARFNKPFVKVFREERHLEIYFAVDISASTNFASSDISKRELIAKISAALAFAANENKDKVGLILFSDKIEKIIKAKTGRTQILKIVRDILEYNSLSAKTNLSNSIEHIANLIKKRSYIFLISDFIDNDYQFALSKLSKNKEVIAIKVADFRESDLPNIGLIKVKDAENGIEHVLDTSSPSAKHLWKNENLRYNNEFIKNAKKCGIDYLILDSNKPYIDELAQLFIKRAKRR